MSYPRPQERRTWKVDARTERFHATCWHATQEEAERHAATARANGYTVTVENTDK